MFVVKNFYGMILMLMFMTLLLPLVVDLMAEPLQKDKAALNIKTAIKYAFLISLPATLLFYIDNQQTTFATLDWEMTSSLSTNFSFYFDRFSIPFVSAALFVSWAILEFALWYMHADPLVNRFFKYMLIFLLMMLVFLTANNLFQLFIGWEGMGIMSFLLIGWWHGRADANTAAMQAVAYNRVGDVGLIMCMAWLATNIDSWDIQHIVILTKNLDLTFPMLGIIIAATGKSAQFGLHPWLPAAMEGPTPVSALLHSSTMVVAGVFLLIRLNPLITNSPQALTLCLCLGALTALFSAICALTQNDIKKIIAFSTSSQLGLMMVSIGLNQPELAFLHIFTHAFFKAMLFMCAGSFIHMLNDEQDIRKMGGMMYLAPDTSAYFTIGCLALSGMPFLSGFFSKDAIIEALNTSHINATALVFTLIATAFTAVYSLRLIFSVVMGQPRYPALSFSNEDNPLVMNPLTRLSVASILVGTFIAVSSFSWEPPVMTMPLPLKLAALLVSLLALMIALQLSTYSKNFEFSPKNKYYQFSNSLGYFPTINHRKVPEIGLVLGQKIASQMVDQAWLEKTGPKAISQLTLQFLYFASNTQQKYTKTHLILFLTCMMTLITTMD
uniref:NADH-ubiquinone oxidoreductase chain 5 n=1 Tax=Physiculus japonicus TaxID=181408 RepID=Q8HMC0_PHYJA|nr:NADH dehydrogenase subunit 5 [Physiculus japonicus]